MHCSLVEMPCVPGEQMEGPALLFGNYFICIQVGGALFLWDLMLLRELTNGWAKLKPEMEGICGK
jgi:hypothetical protein